MMPGQRCCVVGCEQQVEHWVLIRIFDTTHTKQESMKPFCIEHTPSTAHRNGSKHQPGCRAEDGFPCHCLEDNDRRADAPTPVEKVLPSTQAAGDVVTHIDGTGAPK